MGLSSSFRGLSCPSGMGRTCPGMMILLTSIQAVDILKSISQSAKGFTIVELLIVIVVVAILAALSYVGYVGLQNKAHDSAVQSDLRNIGTKIDLFKAEYNTYPYSTNEWSSLELKVTKPSYDTTSGIHWNFPPVYNVLFCKNDSSSRFVLIARSKSGTTFQLANGSVGKYAASVFVSADSLCAGAGIPATLGPDRTWLYDNNAWRSFIGS